MKINSPTHNKLMQKLAAEPQNTKLWAEFARRFNGYIGSVVARALQQRAGAVRLETKDELIQQVYARLLADSARAIRDYRGCEESSVYRYLEIIALRLVLKSMGIRAGSNVT